MIFIIEGVSVRGRTVLGTPHGGEFIFMSFIPDIFKASMTDVVLFANSL
jgi:hypothetical protein